MSTPSSADVAPERETLPNQPHLSSLLTYQQPPLTDFVSVNPQTDLLSLNLSWRESDLPQRQRTKHVHSLHPYLGKFIPQLVEIFLRKFQPRAVFDPFAGSGTTLVEANSLGIAAYGADVSAFNCLISRVKTAEYDLALLDREIRDIFRCASVDKQPSLDTPSKYLNDWYAPEALAALLSFRRAIPGYTNQDVLSLILSRAARSARRARHFDLDFPAVPQREPYYCHKHHRTCHPTTNAAGFLRRYSRDTLARLRAFAELRTSAPVHLFHADARGLQLPPIDLIITSPPYVGLIDYHEQHRYAYELLDLPRNDHLEIGAARKGASTIAQKAYRDQIAAVFASALRFLSSSGRVVVVVGDKLGLYSGLAAELGLYEESRLRRHVNRRTGRRPSEFFEEILIWRRP